MLLRNHRRNRGLLVWVCSLHSAGEIQADRQIDRFPDAHWSASLAYLVNYSPVAPLPQQTKAPKPKPETKQIASKDDA